MRKNTVPVVPVMASPILISNPPPGFSILAIVRGFQLAILGAYRTLQNPSLLTQRFYRQSLIAIQASIVIQALIMKEMCCYTARTEKHFRESGRATCIRMASRREKFHFAAKLLTRKCSSAAFTRTCPASPKPKCSIRLCNV